MEKGGGTYRISVHRFFGVPWRNPKIFAKLLEITVSVVMTFPKLMIFVRLVYLW
jgi:hypothetical protein